MASYSSTQVKECATTTRISKADRCVNKVKGFDYFGQGVRMRLDDGQEVVGSFFGSILTICILALVAGYAI